MLPLGWWQKHAPSEDQYRFHGRVWLSREKVRELRARPTPSPQAQWNRACLCLRQDQDNREPPVSHHEPSTKWQAYHHRRKSKSMSGALCATGEQGLLKAEGGAGALSEPSSTPGPTPRTGEHRLLLEEFKARGPLKGMTATDWPSPAQLLTRGAQPPTQGPDGRESMSISRGKDNSPYFQQFYTRCPAFSKNYKTHEKRKKKKWPIVKRESDPETIQMLENLQKGT